MDLSSILLSLDIILKCPKVYCTILSRTIEVCFLNIIVISLFTRASNNLFQEYDPILKEYITKIMKLHHSVNINLGTLSNNGIEELIRICVRSKLSNEISISPALVEEIKSQSQGIFIYKL